MNGSDRGLAHMHPPHTYRVPFTTTSTTTTNLSHYTHHLLRHASPPVGAAGRVHGAFHRADELLRGGGGGGGGGYIYSGGGKWSLVDCGNDRSTIDVQSKVISVPVDEEDVESASPPPVAPWDAAAAAAMAGCCCSALPPVPVLLWLGLTPSVVMSLDLMCVVCEGGVRTESLAAGSVQCAAGH